CLRVLVRASCTSRYTVSCTPAGTSGACPWTSSVVCSPADRTSSMSASSRVRSGTGARAAAGSSPGRWRSTPRSRRECASATPPGSRHAAHDLGGPFRRAGRRGGRRLAQGDHDGQVMGYDVVHLPGDPGAFGGRGERALLIALAFQPVSAVAQFGEVGAPGGG